MKFSCLLVFILPVFTSIILKGSVYPRNIKWQDTRVNYINGKKNYYLYFDQAFYQDSNNEFPYYGELIEIKDKNGKYNVTIENKVFEPFSYFDFDENNRSNFISNEIKIFTVKRTIRSVNYLEISFIPIRKNPINGDLERLTSFNIRIEKIGIETESGKLKSQNTFINNSVLSSGNWIKIRVDKSGIYKITYKQLKEDMGFSNPQSIRLFGNGGKMLPLMNNESHPDDLIENAVYLEYGPDNKFDDDEDYILFYAEGPVTWEYDEENKLFSHTIHNYTNYIYYFLTTDIGQGKRISNIGSTSLNPTHQITSYDDFVFHENNDTNYILSGRKWFGDKFDYITSHEFNFSFSNRIVSDSIKLLYSLYARSSYESKFTIKVNDVKIKEISILTVDLLSNDSYFARESTETIRFLSNQNDINIFINYNKPLPSSFGFLDYLILNVRSRLVFNGHQMKFRDTKSLGENNIGNFIIETSGEDIHIWELTDIYNIKNINSQKSGNNYFFQLETNTLREFIVFDNTEFYEPEILGKVENQNLHKPEELDMVIATHPNFLEQANQLADFHINNDELKTKVVTTEQVYNEFSSGNPDVAALRNYIKMIYDRESDPNKKIRYLLLFGDGSFDNKSMDKSNSNFILTYQSENSILYHKSFVSDDFFGLLDDNEGEADGYLDIGVGRFPVRSEQEARNMVNKVFKYSRNDNLGNWQNIICFVGDDEDGNTHMIDANNLATYIESNYKNYNIEKIYLDAFEQVTLSIGQSYPDVNQAINDKINKGVFIFNYSGHGGELGLAHERILDVNDIDSWDNIEKLPIFITATCEFSRFDDKNRTSAGEKVLLNANGGGIALLTTTRVVFSNSNYKLNESFYSYVFEKDSITKDYYRLGDIVSLAKRKLINDSNKRNFTLLGDPAIKLKYPTYHIVTDSINNKPVSIFSDTLKALSKVIIHGHVENESQQKIDGFQGVIYPTIFDKPKVIKTLGNDGGSPFTFYTQENIVYKGKATIKNDGEFKFEFIIPKDILYEYGNGKISYYGHYNELIANGYFDDLLIGGTSDQIINDTIGPDIILYFNNENFVYGGFTNEDPVLLAILVDSSGINTVGNAIGHDITAILDSNTQKIYVLNDFYESEIDQYQKGKIEYKLLNLEKGKHHLKLKAWDILNNSSQETIEFIVSESAELAINRIFNYPNPFTDNTAFYFEHNQPFNEIDVIIQIFTVSGKLVKTIETTVNPSGFLIGPINWDGYDDFGDKIGRGVYIYRVKLRSFNNKIVEKYEKLVILK